MPRVLLGQGNKIIAYATSLVSGSVSKPWLVIKSDDAGLWSFEAWPTKRRAEESAKGWNNLENKRCRMVNAARKRKGKNALDRELFDSYYVTHRRDFL